MPIETSCPSCSKSYRLKDEMQGKSFRCKECNATVAVGGPDGTSSGAATQPQKKKRPHLPPVDSDKVRIKSRNKGELFLVTDGDGDPLMEVKRSTNSQELMKLDCYRPENDRSALTISKQNETALEREFVIRRGKKKIGRIKMARSFFLRPWKTYLVLHGRHFATFEGGRRPTRTAERGGHGGGFFSNLLQLFLLIILSPILYVLFGLTFLLMMVSALLAMIVIPIITLVWGIGMLLGLLPDPLHMSIRFFRGPVPVARLTFWGRVFPARLSRIDEEIDLTVCVVLSILRAVGEIRTVNHFQLEDQSMQWAGAWENSTTKR